MSNSLEKHVQRAVKDLLHAMNIPYWDTSQPFAAKITPGVPDLIAICPRRGLFFVEVKRKGGKMSPPQIRFKELAEAVDVPVLVGGVDEVSEFLQTYKRKAAA